MTCRESLYPDNKQGDNRASDLFPSVNRTRNENKRDYDSPKRPPHAVGEGRGITTLHSSRIDYPIRSTTVSDK